MPFAIIEFLEEGNLDSVIEFVPKIWLNSANTICKWPQTKVISKLRKKESIPEKNWGTYKCKLFVPTIIDDFSRASEMTRSLAKNLCRESSTCDELEMDSTSYRTRGQRKKSKRMIIDEEQDSSSEFSDSVSSLDSPTKYLDFNSKKIRPDKEHFTHPIEQSHSEKKIRPNCPKKLRMMAELDVNESGSPQSNDGLSNADSLPGTSTSQDHISEVERCASHEDLKTVFSIDVANMMSEAQISDSNDPYTLKAVCQDLSEIKKSLDELLKTQIWIKNTVRRMNMKYEVASSVAVIEETISKMPNLPIDTEEEFTEVESFLSNDENFSKFASLLQSYGKIDSKVGVLTSSSYVQDILSRTMSNRCAERFNWYGKKSYLSRSDKMSFAETTLWKVIKASISAKKLDNLREAEITAIKWMRQAAFRKGGSRYRRNLLNCSM